MERNRRIQSEMQGRSIFPVLWFALWRRLSIFMEDSRGVSSHALAHQAGSSLQLLQGCYMTNRARLAGQCWVLQIPGHRGQEDSTDKWDQIHLIKEKWILAFFCSWAVPHLPLPLKDILYVHHGSKPCEYFGIWLIDPGYGSLLLVKGCEETSLQI